MKLWYHPSLIFYGGEHLSENFIRACKLLSLNEENIGFVDFLCSDRGQNMTNNNLSIHIESENIFFQNLNANENFIVSFWHNKTKQNQ